MSNISNLQETFDLYSQLSEVSQTAFLPDPESAKQWTQAAKECKYSTAVLAYDTFLHLSDHHLATLPSLPQNLALLKQLVTSLAVDAFSACLRHGNSTNAIELLEQGRRVFWSQLIRPRSPLVVASSDKDKTLAGKFTHVAPLPCFTVSPMSFSMLVLSTSGRGVSASNCRMSSPIFVVCLVSLVSFLQPPLFSHLQVAAAPWSSHYCKCKPIWLRCIGTSIRPRSPPHHSSHH